MRIAAGACAWGLGFALLSSTAAAQTKPQETSEETAKSAPASPPPAPQESEGERTERVDLEATEKEIEAPRPVRVNVPPLATSPETRVEIIVELTIEADGSVSSASLVSGEEPFASATIEASTDWLFVPAKRNGEAVSAKIHFMLTFEVPPAEEPEAIEDEKAPVTAPVAPAQPAQGQVLEEVLVIGQAPDPGGTSITRMEVRNLAGAFDDPLRAIESMPGVTPIASGLPLFFVRGAPPGNVGYFIDGIRVPLLYHAFLGPSVIHPAFIRKVDLHAGPMPTRFGRYAGAAVDIDVEQPPSTLSAEGSVRLIDAGAYVGSPFADGKGYAQVAGRYSYTALLISAFSPGTRLDYWDYQGRVGYALGKKDEVSLFALGAYDYIGTSGEVLGGTEFHRIDARWDHNFTPRDHLRTALTYGRDRTRSDQGYLADQLVGARLNYEHSGKNVLFRSGTDVWVDSYKMDVDPGVSEPEIFLDLFPARTDVQGGVWFDFVIALTPEIQLIPGLRGDVFYSLGETRFGLDPRLSAEFQLTEKLRAVHEIGVAHQTPNFVPNVPGAQVAGLDGGLQRNLQAATKYEYQLPWNLTGSVAFFINGTQDLTDPIGLQQNFAIDETSKDARSLGRAYGMEIYLKRALTRRLGGLLSYTYSRSLRSFGSITTKPGYDRPHVLNAALTYEIGWGVRLSTKVAFASGVPGSETTLQGPVFNQSRSAPYIRLDAKAEKRWTVSENFNWGLHAEVLNATNTGNVTTRKCGVDGCENSGTLPITFPSIGVDAAWQ